MILFNAGMNYPEFTIRTALPPWWKKKGGKNKRISEFGFLISELVFLSNTVFQYHLLKPPHLCGSREGAGGEYMNSFHIMLAAAITDIMAVKITALIKISRR